MKNKIFLIIAALFVVSMVGCTKLYHMNQSKEYKPEVMEVGALAGEWYVQYTLDDGTDQSGGYVLLDTYNDAANAGDSLWITDYDGSSATFWMYTVKVACDASALTFSVPDSSLNAEPDYGYNMWMKVKNGKVIKDAVTLPSTTVVDSIYFEIEYNDDPGTIYYCAGYRRSGFLEDEPE